ncbi:hypothetical protein PT2222_10133 [Paraburkholderia tropica]
MLVNARSVPIADREERGREAKGRAGPLRRADACGPVCAARGA